MKFLKLLKYIKLHEKQGIGISQRLIDNCQMTCGPMEYFFNQKNIYVNCWNYTTQQLELLYNDDNLSLNEENLAPPGLTQTSNMNPIDDIDFDDDMFNDCDGIPSLYETNTLSNHVKNPYGYLKPYFSQMIDILDGNCNMDELIAIKEMFLKVTSEKQKELSDRRSNVSIDYSNENSKDGIPPLNNNTPEYASSNVISETHLKTHGTSHY